MPKTRIVFADVVSLFQGSAAPQRLVNHNGAMILDPLQGTGHTMATFSLREAAQQAGTSKSTILRAIQGGRLSAARNDDGGYAIDPAELFRVYAPKPADAVADRGAGRSTGQDASDYASAEIVEIRIRNAKLESEGQSLRAILDAEKRRADELRHERDRWAAQAERLAITGPANKPSNGRMFGWLKRA